MGTEAIREQQRRLQTLLAATGSRLPDRGAQLRRRIQDLEAKLTAAETADEAIQPSTSGKDSLGAVSSLVADAGGMMSHRALDGGAAVKQHPAQQQPERGQQSASGEVEAPIQIACTDSDTAVPEVASASVFRQTEEPTVTLPEPQPPPPAAETVVDLSTLQKPAGILGAALAAPFPDYPLPQSTQPPARSTDVGASVTHVGHLQT